MAGGKVPTAEDCRSSSQNSDKPLTVGSVLAWFLRLLFPLVVERIRGRGGRLGVDKCGVSSVAACVLNFESESVSQTRFG